MILTFSQTMESCIKQNNAIEIYQDYFNEIDESTDCQEPKAKVSRQHTQHLDNPFVSRLLTCTVTPALLRDTSGQSAASPGTRTESSEWSQQKETIINTRVCRIAISYCNLEFLGLQPETPRTSYIFNIGH